MTLFFSWNLLWHILSGACLWLWNKKSFLVALFGMGMALPYYRPEWVTYCRGYYEC